MGSEVDALWRVEDEVTVSTPSGELTVYMRTISDMENDNRVKEALAAARRFRVRLSDKGSDEYRWHIAHLDDASSEALRDIAVELRRIELARESISEVFARSWPEPKKDADVEGLIKVEEQREKIEADVEDARSDWIEKGLEVYREQLAEMPDERLMEIAVAGQTTSAVNGVFQQSMDRATVHYACFRDDGYQERLFPTLKSVEDANHRVVDQLIARYRELDRWTRGSDGLKKSPAPAE